jgi:hypothetical protein
MGDFTIASSVVSFPSSKILYTYMKSARRSLERRVKSPRPWTYLGDDKCESVGFRVFLNSLAFDVDGARYLSYDGC